jgi:UDP-N-acetylmuramoyl-tripeptide--D-alanyl-D-alanine ligase
MHSMNWSLRDIASVLAVVAVGDADVCVQRVITDSRKASAGDLFVALVGERANGHDFIESVIAQGAVAVLLTQAPKQHVSVPYLLVEDAVSAMQQLAAAWRLKHQLNPVVLITGSNGKTSVKEMIRAGLSARDDDAVLATEGNLNNHLGVPMTLLSLRDTHASAVIEVGANHVGEIAFLGPLAAPSIAVITSIGRAHIGEFGSLDHIKRGKGEIWQALPSTGGVAVVPVVEADSEFDAWSVWQDALAPHRVIAFGDMANLSVNRGWQAWVGVVQRQATAGGQLIRLATSDWGEAMLQLPIAGAHQANNLAAVVAVLLQIGLSWQTIQTGLNRVALPGGRLRWLTPLPDLLVIDDTYNANASSMKAAIAVLMEQLVKNHAFVMGPMGELGDESQALHEQVVDFACEAGVNAFLASGPLSASLVQRFDVQQPLANVALASEDTQRLAEVLWQLYQQKGSLAVLVKGSRSARMERVVEALVTLASQSVN